MSVLLRIWPLIAVVGQARDGMPFELLVWLGGMFVTLLAGAAFLLWFRRRSRVGGEVSAKLPWTLSDLRHQRDQGRLTASEYEALKEIVIRDAK